ncbi:MAG TPA: hypothetical protein VMG34_02020 [Bacteroidota bacterium]|nr:hypothetical protein [Bacteroidota bacterium]
MLVRELKPVASARAFLGQEDLCVLGNISMQGKFAKEGPERKVLRPPAPMDGGKPACVYIYSENSLLRRVVVIRTRSAIYEVELLQDSETLSLASVLDAQRFVVKSLQEE